MFLVEKAIEQAHRFEPDTHLDRWCFVIARRLWLNDKRATKVRTGQGLVAVEDIDIPDPATNSGTETNILARQVLDMVQELPDGQRLAVLLVYVEGLSYKEAAATLDVPIGTIMSRLSTARKTMSTKLADGKPGK